MSSTLFARLENAGRLPTPPAVVIRLLDLTRRSDVSVREVADTIAMDAALAAKILRFVNSPMAGVSREVSSLQQAVALMGVRGVKMMALSLAVVAPRTTSPCTGFDRDHYAIQSLACGAAARIIACAVNAPSPQEAFSAGLLSQIGRAALAHGVPDEYAVLLKGSTCPPRDLPQCERAALGATYAEIGGHLLRRWGLPEPLCRSVAAFRGENAPERGSMEVILNAAEIAACVICSSPQGHSLPPENFLTELELLFGMERAQATSLLADIARDTEASRSLLDLPAARLRSPEEIESEVRERLTELNLAMHLENQTMASQQADLLRRATTDALTGIGNRAAFDARLQLELDRGARNDAPVALLMLDVDHFKKLNDAHGHQAGDRVLQAVARTLDDSVRKIDYVARYGGEEFAVIAPSSNKEGALMLAERLRDAVATTPVTWEGQELRVTVSIGVAVLRDLADHQSAAHIIPAADAQLYLAKSAGRNRVHCAQDQKVAAACAAR